MGLAMSKFLNTTTHFSVSEFLSLMITSLANGLTRFTGLTGDTGAVATESDVSQMMSGNITIVRVVAKANSNSLDGATTVDFMDDGVAVAGVSIPAGSTAIVDSGAISIAVAAGSLCDLRFVTAGTLGAIDQVAVTVQYQRVLN